MAVPKRVLLLTSAAFAFFSARYAPGVAPFHAQSYVKNTVAVFAVLYFTQLVWGVFVYPLFLSPLRKLPTPDVSFHFSYFFLCCLESSPSLFVIRRLWAKDGEQCGRRHTDIMSNRARTYFLVTIVGYSVIQRVSRREIGSTMCRMMVFCTTGFCSMNLGSW
jgi:hypothetical protein